MRALADGRCEQPISVGYVTVCFVHVMLHDLGDDVILGLAQERRVSHMALWVRRSDEVDQASLTSMSSRLSCWPIHLNTFFLLLSCISPASRSSSRMK